MSKSAHTRVILTGFMASGKSRLGARLADLLSWRFVDLDQELEDALGVSIARLFRTEGEAVFREHEAEALKRVLEWEHVVISLGGGAFAEAGNRARALEAGTVVWIDVPLEEIVRRLEASGENRPVLHGNAGVQLTGDALRARVSGLMENRAAAYRRAHLRFRAVPGQSIEENAEHLRSMLTEHGVVA